MLIPILLCFVISKGGTRTRGIRSDKKYRLHTPNGDFALLLSVYIRLGYERVNGEDAGRPENVGKVYLFSLAGFVWWLCQRFYNVSTLIFYCEYELGGAQPCLISLYQRRVKKKRKKRQEKKKTA